MQTGFYFNQARCTGCGACMVACKDWHDIPAGPVNRVRIKTVEEGEYPQVAVYSIFRACFHCASPPCAQACPAGAIAKRSVDGLVLVDREACLGRETCGGQCLEVCPYGSPQFAGESGFMQKCDLCRERLDENKKPVCVEACPVRALDAGQLDQLVKNYGAGKEARGFVNSPSAGPSVVFRPKQL